MNGSIFLLGAVLLATPQPEVQLQQAYLKELAFLKAERQALKNQLRELSGQEPLEVEKLKQETESSEGRLLLRQRQIQDAENRLTRAEEKTSASTPEDQIQSLLADMKTVLSSAGMEPNPVEAEAGLSVQVAAFNERFKLFTGLLNEERSLRRTSGRFFLVNGTETQGEILRVGSVAAFGHSPDGSGALAPAGPGRLRLWPESSAEPTAKALFAGQTPSSLSIFLFEGSQTNVDPDPERTLFDEISLGGLIGWVIVGLGLFGALMILIRIGLLSQIGWNIPRASRAILAHVKRDNLAAARNSATKFGGPAGRVAARILAHLERDPEELESVFEEAMTRESPRIERFGTAILVFAAVAPLLGLLGTVSGMIGTFEVITEFGTGDPRLLSGGISEALVTTKLGLLVAIPSLLLGSVLNAWGDAKVRDLEQLALTVVNHARGLGEPSLPAARPEPAPRSGRPVALHPEPVVAEAR